MQHVLFGQKSIFLGDTAAEALLTYAGHVAQLRTGDTVAMQGINSEGNVVTTRFLLNAGTNLVAESTNMRIDEPDNSDVIEYIRARVQDFSLNEDFFDAYGESRDLEPPHA